MRGTAVRGGMTILGDDRGGMTILGDDGTDSLPPGASLFMWLIYAECGTCGAEAKQPCVGQQFGPHEGRPARWDKDREAFEALTARVREAMDEMAVQALANGYVPPVDEHGMRGGTKWLVSGQGAEPAVFEGGYLCHCGELFVRTAGQGGMKAAFEALIVHEGGAVLP